LMTWVFPLCGSSACRPQPASTTTASALANNLPRLDHNRKTRRSNGHGTKNGRDLPEAARLPHPVAAGILPAVEGGILPPGPVSEVIDVQAMQPAIPPLETPGSTAGRMPAAPAQARAGAVMRPIPDPSPHLDPRSTSVLKCMLVTWQLGLKEVQRAPRLPTRWLPQHRARLIPDMLGDNCLLRGIPAFQRRRCASLMTSRL
jgi:hypothetical protein